MQTSGVVMSIIRLILHILYYLVNEKMLRGRVTLPLSNMLYNVIESKIKKYKEL